MSVAEVAAIWCASVVMIAAMSGERRGARVAFIVCTLLLAAPLFVAPPIPRALLVFAFEVAFVCSAMLALGSLCRGSLRQDVAGFWTRILFVVCYLAFVDLRELDRERVKRRVPRAMIALLIIASSVAIWFALSATDRWLRWHCGSWRCARDTSRSPS